MFKAALKWLALHAAFGAAWIAGFYLLPEKPSEVLAFVYTFGGGVLALFGPTVIGTLRGWFD